MSGPVLGAKNTARTVGRHINGPQLPCRETRGLGEENLGSCESTLGGHCQRWLSRILEIPKGMWM